MLVDDDPDITTSFSLSLEDTGLFEVETYNDSVKALSNFKVCFLTASEKYHEGLREGEYQTLSKDLFIQKPLSIKDLTKEIHKRIGSK